jgi:hypothetical protein
LKDFLYNDGAYILLAEIVGIPLLAIYLLNKFGKKGWTISIFACIAVVVVTCFILKGVGTPGFSPR